MPSINNFLNSFSNGLPGTKDYQHASRLYIDDNYRLMPKQKFLFHVVFDIDDDTFTREFSSNEKSELNMLVKSVDLPKYNLNLEEKQQYNKKTYVGTRISYTPINLTFHDDHYDIVNAFWKAYYEYNIVDSITVASTGGLNNQRDTMYDSENKITRTQFGMDGRQKRKHPLLRSIQIFALHKQDFTSFTLINPRIGSFSHDDLDQADGGGIMANTMQIFYETVLYSAGNITKNNPRGFATVHYDREPSPLTALGGGTTSIFGPGGIVDGIGSVIGSAREGNYLGAVLQGINTYNNAKKIKAKDAVKEELKGIVKEGVIGLGRQAGTITNPAGQYSIGNVGTQAALLGVTAATAYGIADSNKKQKNNTNTVVNNPVLDTQNFYSPSESFNLVSTNQALRDEVSAGIYFKVVGARQGLTVAQSNVAYNALDQNAKNVYRSRTLTDITKLVTEGYVKINRQTLDVTIVAEKANI